jgi:hypothetical protein
MTIDLATLVLMTFAFKPENNELQHSHEIGWYSIVFSRVIADGLSVW